MCRGGIEREEKNRKANCFNLNEGKLFITPTPTTSIICDFSQKYAKYTMTIYF